MLPGFLRNCFCSTLFPQGQEKGQERRQEIGESSSKSKGTGKIAIINTSSPDFGDKEDTGIWLEETAAPYYIFQEAGYEVVIVSMAGGEIPVDPGSRQGDFYTEAAKRFDKDVQAMNGLAQSKDISDVKEDIVKDYVAIYLSGGHGTCTDFPDSLMLVDLIQRMIRANKVVAADCHGPIALVNCKKPDGAPLVQGLEVTGFSNEEEKQVGLFDAVSKYSYVIEDQFVKQGAKYQKADPWCPKVCVSGKLVTGQNPQSAVLCAETVLAVLSDDK